jgi:hypothetical protein
MGLMIPIVPYVLSRNRSRSRETIRFALPAKAQAKMWLSSGSSFATPVTHSQKEINERRLAFEQKAIE